MRPLIVRGVFALLAGALFGTASHVAAGWIP